MELLPRDILAILAPVPAIARILHILSKGMAVVTTGLFRLTVRNNYSTSFSEYTMTGAYYSASFIVNQGIGYVLKNYKNVPTVRMTSLGKYLKHRMKPGLDTILIEFHGELCVCDRDMYDMMIDFPGGDAIGRIYEPLGVYVNTKVNDEDASLPADEILYTTDLISVLTTKDSRMTHIGYYMKLRILYEY